MVHTQQWRAARLRSAPRAGPNRLTISATHGDGPTKPQVKIDTNTVRNANTILSVPAEHRPAPRTRSTNKQNTKGVGGGASTYRRRGSEMATPSPFFNPFRLCISLCAIPHTTAYYFLDRGLLTGFFSAVDKSQLETATTAHPRL